MAAKTAIIGCGNTNRSDDGVGAYIIGLLQTRKLGDNVALFDAGTDGMGVLYRARGVTRLIIIDARMPEGSPGAIYRVPGETLQAPPAHSLNLHDFRWDHALFAGKQIYGDAFPKEVAVFLIEAENIDLGLELSSSVEKAAHIAADQIEALVRGGDIHAPINA